jgi:curli biogenesis system outer membrane secretion channel CsgG
MRKKAVRIGLGCLLAVSVLCFAGCMESMVKPTATTDTGSEMGLPPYSGPKAKVAVADFEWKVGGSGSKTTITGAGGKPITITHSRQQGYTTGLRDMLTTAMVQTSRFRVLERQNIGSLKQEMALSDQGYTDKSGVKKGAIKGADLLIMGAVTGWDPGSSGVGGGLGGGTLGKLAGVMGSMKKSKMAMDIRLVDTSTSEVLSATRVEGEAKEVNLGALAGVAGGSGALAGGLGGYAKTPMEKAIRTCIYNAVKYISENTPQEYMKH